MKRFKGFLAMLLCVVMAVTLIPAFGETKAKADTLPAGLENATLVRDDLRVSLSKIPTYEAMNMKLGDFLDRFYSANSMDPLSNFKAYKIIEGYDYTVSSYPVVFANIDSTLQTTNGKVEGWYLNHNSESYIPFGEGFSSIRKIALVFGENNNTITSNDKVYIVSVDRVESPRFTGAVYDASGNEKMVAWFDHDRSFSQGNTFILELLDDSWSENSKGYAVFGFDDVVESEGLSVTIYSGYYESVSDIPSNAKDITNDVWRGTDKTTRKNGLLVTGSEKVPITIVLKRDGKVVDVLARYVGIQKKLAGIGDQYLFVDNSANYFWVDSNYEWNKEKNYEVRVFKPNNDMAGFDKYCIHFAASKGKINGKGTEYVYKAVQGWYNSLSEANAANAKDIKDQLFGDSVSVANGFVLTPGINYEFSFFFKDGGVAHKVIRLELPANAGPVITVQPSNVTVNNNETAYFSVRASGTGLKYLWQYKEKGKDFWTDWTAKTTADISVAYAASRNGMKLRCVVTDSNGKSVTSDEAVLRYSSGKTVAINAANFPDDLFRKYIKDSYDMDGDDYLSEEEIANITTVDYSENELTSVKGIEFFPDLQYLSVYENKIKSIDISKNPDLYYLEIDGNNIATIDLTNNPILWEIFTNDKCQVLRYDGYNYIYFGQDDDKSCVSIPMDTTVILGGTGNAAIIRQPESIEVEQDKVAGFAVAATGKGLKYQWQYKNAGASSWTTWTSKTNSVISVAYAASRQGMSVRCIVTDANGNKVTSSPAVLTYDIPL
nr:hypothetical protein [Lachnospiraceae bacterium]